MPHFGPICTLHGQPLPYCLGINPVYFPTLADLYGNIVYLLPYYYLIYMVMSYLNDCIIAMGCIIAMVCMGRLSISNSIKSIIFSLFIIVYTVLRFWSICLPIRFILRIIRIRHRFLYYLERFLGGVMWVISILYRIFLVDCCEYHVICCEIHGNLGVLWVFLKAGCSDIR